MIGPSEESIISELKDKTLPKWVRDELEGDLDWIRRGRPEDEVIPKWMIEKMTCEAGGPIPKRFKHLQHLNEK